MIISLNKELIDQAREASKKYNTTSIPYFQRVLKVDFKTAEQISAIFKEESNTEKGLD